MPYVSLVEVQLSNYQIEKATARLAYHRAAVHRLGFDADTRLAELAQETLVVMESRLAALLVEHPSLVEQQQNCLSMTHSLRFSGSRQAAKAQGNVA